MKRAKRRDDVNAVIRNVYDGRSFVIDDKVREYDDDIFELYKEILQEIPAEPKPKKAKDAAETKPNIENQEAIDG